MLREIRGLKSPISKYTRPTDAAFKDDYFYFGIAVRRTDVFHNRGFQSPEKVKIMHEKIIGAILGLACGDALGAPAEFQPKRMVEQRWGKLTEMVGGGIWASGEWTDDTGMMLCMAEGILANPMEPVEEVGKRFLEWHKTAKDVGGTIAAAIRGYRGDWFAASRNTPQALSGKAGGNGSLMRTLPVALFYRHTAKVIRQGARLSAMTHFDPQAEACCAVYNLWVKRLLRNQPRLSAWNDAVATVRELAATDTATEDTPGMSPLPENFWQRLEAIDGLAYTDLQPSGYAGYVVECLEAAVWCCLHAESLEEALILAVNLGGEADTIAAVAGGAAGAYWGKNAIPARWLQMLHRRDRLEAIGEQIAARHQEKAGYGQSNHPAFEFHWVAPNLFAGRNPLTERDVRELADLGITHYLDLREAYEYTAPHLGQEALDAMQTQGIVRVHLPVVDGGKPDHTTFEQSVDFLQTTLETPSNRVYVSCRAGKERTAAILIAHYSVHHKVIYNEALAALRIGRPTLNPLPHQESATRNYLRALSKQS